MSKNISLMDFNGNPNIGIYMYVNDKFCLIGQQVNEEKKKEIEKTFKVPVYNITIINSELIGIFLAGNNEFLLCPEVFKEEEILIKEICEKHNVKLINIHEIKNTFGNNICFGEEEILINGNYEKEFVDKIKKETKLKIIEIKSKTYEAIGSTAIFLNGKYFFSQDYEKIEIKKIMDKIAGIGTINSGLSYISSGIVGNSNGVIIGSQSTTIEIQNIVETLEYL